MLYADSCRPTLWTRLVAHSAKQATVAPLAAAAAAAVAADSHESRSRSRTPGGQYMHPTLRTAAAGTLRAGLLGLASVWALSVWARSAAADWARDMFEVTQHDFGTIAAGAKAEFPFKFTNKYLYEVHAVGVRSSCGCSDVRITKDSLATYETGEVVASINSQRLRGRQGSTLTVIFDKPHYAEVQLKVSVYIRGDVLLEPSGFEFGEIDQGAASSRKLTVTHYGTADWKLVDVQSTAEHLACELGAPERSGTRVSYPVTAKLAADAPPGDLRTQLLLVTNDPRAEKIPVMVVGHVRPSLSVAPASLYLGSVRPGQSVTKRLVVRAAKPFHIQEISTDCDCFEFSYGTDEAKALHLVPVTFTAGDKPSGVKRTIRIKTDLNGTQAELVAWAAVDEQAR
jgi:hypothetical protein